MEALGPLFDVWIRPHHVGGAKRALDEGTEVARLRALPPGELKGTSFGDRRGPGIECAYRQRSAAGGGEGACNAETEAVRFAKLVLQQLLARIYAERASPVVTWREGLAYRNDCREIEGERLAAARPRRDDCPV